MPVGSVCGTKPVEIRIARVETNGLHLELTTNAESFDIWFRASVPLFTERADALVPLGILAAMRRWAPLVVSGAVSPQLIETSRTAQDILAAFAPGKMVKTSMVAEPAQSSPVRGEGVGSFFSAGVDSFHTVLKRKGELSHLVFVHGFDIVDRGTPRAVAGAEAVRRLAADLGMELIEVETNIRWVMDRFSPWTMASGSAISATALLLQAHLRRVFIPSSFSYQRLLPWGSHPLLDRLWGTEALEIVHDGCEATRVQKVKFLAVSDGALRDLRVCNYQHSTYNCGVCEKCLRTTVNLRLAGALGRCPTLPQSVAWRQVAKVQISDPGAEPFWREIRQAAVKQRDWPVAVVSTWLFRPRPVLAARSAGRRLRHVVATSAVGRYRARRRRKASRPTGSGPR